MQLELFDNGDGRPCMALERYKGPPCAYGTPLGYWLGPHHCGGCMMATVESTRQFWADVRAGKYNARGYTKREWKRAGYPVDEWATATDERGQAG